MVAHGGMNDARIETLLRRMFPDLEGEPGIWRAPVDDFDLFITTDEDQDRIRIMIPVARAERADNDLLWVLLVANYDLAADARYAIHHDLVWCTFQQRLSWFTEPELHNAVNSVITLARNTGSTFSSTDLVVEGG